MEWSEIIKSQAIEHMHYVSSNHVNIRKELNSRIGFVHQHGYRSIVLEHQYCIYGCHDVMCICSILRMEEKGFEKWLVF